MERYTAADNGAPPHPNDVTRRRFPRIYQPIQQDEEYLVSRLDNKMVITPVLLRQLFATFSHSHFSAQSFFFFFFQKSCLPEFGLFYFIILIFFFITKTQNVISWVFFNHILSKTNSSCRFWFSLWVNTIEILISGALETIDQITIM